MSVDKELERAIEEAEAEASVAATVQAAPARPDAPKPKGSLGLLISLLVIVAGVLVLVFTSFKGSAIYSVGVDKLLKEQERYNKRSIKVTGMLVKGTLMRRDEPCEYRFKLKMADTVLPVAYRRCVVPDTFKDMPGMDVMVTAEGKLAPNGTGFEATDIMAKCPSKYEMQELSMAGQKAPHPGKQAAPVGKLDKFADQKD